MFCVCVCVCVVGAVVEPCGLRVSRVPPIPPMPPAPCLPHRVASVWKQRRDCCCCTTLFLGLETTDMPDMPRESLTCQDSLLTGVSLPTYPGSLTTWRGSLPTCRSSLPTCQDSQSPDILGLPQETLQGDWGPGSWGSVYDT